MKTPIKDKTRISKSTSTLKHLIPRGKIVDTYLFYGGEQEINLCHSGRTINAHTNRLVVYKFWETLLEDSRRVERSVEGILNTYGKVPIATLQRDWLIEKDRWASAALFFVLNYFSSEGLISSGVSDKTSIDPMSLFYLKTFADIEGFSIAYCPWEDITSLFDENTDCDYIFVPCSSFNYNLFEYGKNRGIEQSIVRHKQMRDTLRQIDKKWIVGYNYHKDLCDFYAKENVLMIDNYGNITEQENKCAEVLLYNFEQ